MSSDSRSAPDGPEPAAARQLRGDGLLAAAPAHRPGRHGHNRIHGARLGHLVERLRPGGDARSAVGYGEEGDPYRPRPPGPPLPAALPARGGPGRLKVVVTNRRKSADAGEVTLDVTDPETGESLLAAFGLDRGRRASPSPRRPAAARASSSPSPRPGVWGRWPSRSPASAGDESDGEAAAAARAAVAGAPRPVALRRPARRGQARELRFATWSGTTIRPASTSRWWSPSRAQLFQGVLAALPYLVHLSLRVHRADPQPLRLDGDRGRSVDRYPAVARLAAELAKRETPLETCDAADPNRKLALEETPWLEAARGGGEAGHPQRARPADRPRPARRLPGEALADAALQRRLPLVAGRAAVPLHDRSTSLHGLARAVEFGVEVPREVVRGVVLPRASAEARESGSRTEEMLLGVPCCSTTRPRPTPTPAGWATPSPSRSAGGSSTPASSTGSSTPRI